MYIKSIMQLASMSLPYAALVRLGGTTGNCLYWEVKFLVAKY